MKPAPSVVSCAICAKPVDPAFRPFCSKRCADVDLHRWLSGRYVVAGEPAEDESDRLAEPDDEG